NTGRFYPVIKLTITSRSSRPDTSTGLLCRASGSAGGKRDGSTSVFENNKFKNNKFKKNHLSEVIIALVATAFSAQHAFAQENQQAEDADKASPGAIEEVVVSGVRYNLQNAQDIKRDADTFVDSISSEDMGSLPDRSVLEAMQRMPGISIERFAG